MDDVDDVEDVDNVETNGITTQINGFDNVGDYVGDYVENVGNNGGDGGDVLEAQRQSQIILLISQKNTISSKQLSEIISVSKKTIERDIEKLKLTGKLQRIGKQKGGYWQIITKN